VLRFWFVRDKNKVETKKSSRQWASGKKSWSREDWKNVNSACHCARVKHIYAYAIESLNLLKIWQDWPFRLHNFLLKNALSLKRDVCLRLVLKLYSSLQMW
jgi:hypothetical protein